MKLKFTFTLLLFLYLANPLFSCSCSKIHFCEYVDSEESFLAFRGVVIGHSEFEPFANGFGGQAIYVKIVKKYKDNIGVSDTIKLYGSGDGASCAADLIQRPIGSTMICAIGEANHHNGAINNPDSLTENYWEWFPSACNFPNLKLEEETVKGLIMPTVEKYPLKLFEERLSNCNFPFDDLLEFNCSEKVTIYPNPSLDGNVTIESSYFANSIQSIEVYHIDGSPMNSFQSYDIIDNDKIEVKGFRFGVNILKLTVNNETCFKKVVSNQTQ